MQYFTAISIFVFREGKCYAMEKESPRFSMVNWCLGLVISKHAQSSGLVVPVIACKQSWLKKMIFLSDGRRKSPWHPKCKNWHSRMSSIKSGTSFGGYQSLNKENNHSYHGMRTPTKSRLESSPRFGDSKLKPSLSHDEPASWKGGSIPPQLMAIYFFYLTLE